MTHKFAIGEIVFFTPGFHGAVAGNYEICRLMPPSDYQIEPHYRIKSKVEPHERIATQSHLMLPRDAIIETQTSL